MLNGDIRSKIDALWNAFWTGGISNPLEVIEQITYLLFLKRLDDLHTLEENKAARLKLGKLERRVFPAGKDPKGRAYDDCRWSRFKHFEAKEMFEVVDQHVFPFLRTLGGDDSTYAHHMRDARFTIPTPALLAKVVDMIDGVPMEDRDTKGDLYEFMLGKIASAGQNGQFRTPRHIIQLMVELVQPVPTDVMCDPASGTCGFPVAVGEYLRVHHPEILRDAKLKAHFHRGLFHAFDFDNTMLRIGSMNMLLHGVENPDIRYRDSLAQDHAGEEEKYTLITANSPFAGSLDYETCAKDLLQVVKTKKTELLFLALYLRLSRSRMAGVAGTGIQSGGAGIFGPEGGVFLCPACAGAGGGVALQTRCRVEAAVSGQPECADPRADVQGGGRGSGLQQGAGDPTARQRGGAQPAADPAVRCADGGSRAFPCRLLAHAYLRTRSQASAGAGVQP